MGILLFLKSDFNLNWFIEAHSTRIYDAKNFSHIIQQFIYSPYILYIGHKYYICYALSHRNLFSYRKKSYHLNIHYHNKKKNKFDISTLKVRLKSLTIFINSNCYFQFYRGSHVNTQHMHSSY